MSTLRGWRLGRTVANVLCKQKMCPTKTRPLTLQEQTLNKFRQSEISISPISSAFYCTKVNHKQSELIDEPNAAQDPLTPPATSSESPPIANTPVEPLETVTTATKPPETVSTATAPSSAAAVPSLSITEQILQTRITPVEPPPPPQPTSTSGSNSTGDGSSSEGASQEKQSWFTRNAWKVSLGSIGFFALTAGGLCVMEWGAPKRDDDGVEIEDEFSHLPTSEQYLKRTYRECILFQEMIQEPIRPQLLPEPLSEPYYQPPYTLVLEMTGVLVHPDWTYRTGWRFKKRPQVEHFLQQVTMPLFEIVVFTSEHAMTAYPIIDNLDPNGYIMYRLFRDSTKYKNGVHYKDLSHLNRDPKRIIMVDWDATATSLQSENTIKGIKRWKGEDDDRTLMDLAAFLRALAYSGVDDVRTVLAHYNQFDDPLTVFKDNQRRLAEEQELQVKMQQEQLEKKSLAGGAFRDLWGRRR